MNKKGNTIIFILDILFIIIFLIISIVNIFKGYRF